MNVILEFQRGVTYGWKMIVCVYHQSASIYLPTLKLLYKSYLVPMEFGNCILYGSYLAQILQGLHVTHRHVVVKKYIIIYIYYIIYNQIQIACARAHPGLGLCPRASCNWVLHPAPTGAQDGLDPQQLPALVVFFKVKPHLHSWW